MKRRAALVIVLVGAGIVGVAALATSLTLCSSGAVSAARPGWDEKWRGIDEAVGSDELLGLTREDVVEMYGEPMTTERLREWDMVYWLGPVRSSMSVQSEWLVLKLEGGKVTRSGIVKD